MDEAMTLCLFVTADPDGSITSTAHGPITAVQRSLIEAIAGPPVVDLLADPDVMAAARKLPGGVVYVHGEG